MCNRITLFWLAGMTLVMATEGCRKNMNTEANRTVATDAAARSCPGVDFTLQVDGPGLADPRMFTYRELCHMDMLSRDDVLMRKSHEDDELTSWRGPSVEKLLESAGLKDGAMVVTLEAADGYEIEASLGDLKDAVVAVQDGGGRWLVEVDHELPVKLVLPHKPGNFWVMNPIRINVAPAEDE